MRTVTSCKFSLHTIGFRYKSPEYLYNQSYGFKLDSWSIGMILFALISNDELYNSETDPESIGKLANLYEFIFGVTVDKLTKQLIKEVYKPQDTTDGEGETSKDKPIKFRPLEFDEAFSEMIPQPVYEILISLLDVNADTRMSLKQLVNRIKEVFKEEKIEEGSESPELDSVCSKDEGD